MTTVTIESLNWSGGREIGVNVARLCGATYFDSLILEKAADRIGATVEEIQQIEQRAGKLSEFIRVFFRRSLGWLAIVDFEEEHLMNPLIAKGLDESLEAPPRRRWYRPYEDADDRFVNAITQAMKEVVKAGNAVVEGHGGCVLLKGDPRVLHVAVVADKRDRISRIMESHSLTQEKAARYLGEVDGAKKAYFRRLLKANPADSLLYDIVINTSKVSLPFAADTIVSATKRLERTASN